jgi:hypothetical protein
MKQINASYNPGHRLKCINKNTPLPGETVHLIVYTNFREIKREHRAKNGI